MKKRFRAVMEGEYVGQVALKPMKTSSRSLLQFSLHEATGNISTSIWMGC